MPWPSTSSPSDARRLWAALAALLLAVLAPTVCVLWFMNQAVANERWAVRQRLQDVYQGELAARQKRLGEQWKQVEEDLSMSRVRVVSTGISNIALTEPPAGVFRKL